MSSFVLRGGLVVDGTGAPGQRTDVRVEGGKIAAVGADAAKKGATEIDVSGLVVAPGFIDNHTHLDAQVLWDPDLTPSSWHGVTSVIMGNCGFGIAPTRAIDRDFIARTLENVEGMSAAALGAGIRWDFESFPEYLETLSAAKTRINVAAMVGHSALRLYVMGQQGVERNATPAEVERMKGLLREALEAGAAGFATSAQPLHIGANGKPVPSRFADIWGETAVVAMALREAGRGTIQYTYGPGLMPEEGAMLSKLTGRPVTWTAALTGDLKLGDLGQMLDRTTQLGGQVWPQVSCRPLSMQLTMADPMPFGREPAFSRVLAADHEGRKRIYQDPAWRAEVRGHLSPQWPKRFDLMTLQETTKHPELRGAGIGALARQRNVHPFDLILDLSLAEDLRTRFLIVLANSDEAEIARLLADKRTLLGLSDAGAHATQLCDACFTTYLLGYWVREKKALSLETAIWRLTGQPAAVFNLPGRGRIAPGFAADIVAFDADTVEAVQPPQRVHDLPAGADRLIVQSRGMEHIWVNGVQTRKDGKEIAGSRPGQLIKSAAATA